MPAGAPNPAGIISEPLPISVMPARPTGSYRRVGALRRPSRCLGPAVAPCLVGSRRPPGVLTPLPGWRRPRQTKACHQGLLCTNHVRAMLRICPCFAPSLRARRSTAPALAQVSAVGAAQSGRFTPRSSTPPSACAASPSQSCTSSAGAIGRSSNSRRKAGARHVTKRPGDLATDSTTRHRHWRRANPIMTTTTKPSIPRNTNTTRRSIHTSTLPGSQSRGLRPHRIP